MKDQNPNENQYLVRFANWVIKWRWPVLAASLAAIVAAAAGGKNLTFSSDYREFFSEKNPQLEAFEALQNIYTKNDNILIVVAPDDGDVFTGRTLAAVEELVEGAWQIPFAIRVDGVTNFQHTEADGDDLAVRDLVKDAASLSADELDRIRTVALAEPLLVNRLVSGDGSVIGVNVTLQFPEKELDETSRAAAFARQLAGEIENRYPHIETHLTGMAMLNNAFQEAAIRDMQTLVPIMYLGVMVVMFIALRSVSGTFATVVIIGSSVATAMGIAGWLGIKLTAPSSTAPTMIMTLAVADSIHILVTMVGAMRRGVAKLEALVESLRVNLQPVFLTSVTTAVGFLSMNFSDAPPFHDLGNMTAMGVGAAFLFSVVTLPALVAVLPMRVKLGAKTQNAFVDRIANFVIAQRTPLLWGSSALVLGLALLVPRNELNDQFVDYFDQSVTFRQDADFANDNLTGIYQVDFSLESGESGGISEPDYLATIDAFADWYRTQPNVTAVTVLSETMERLNRNMHGDDPAWHRLPEERDLAAQYLLLYEMSLPYGLDLNNQINVDKSATRVTVAAADMTSLEIRQLADAGEAWLVANAPAAMHTEGVGTSVMFAHISDRNIKGMLKGTTLAFLFVSVMLVVAFRSLRYGALSLIPNLVPAVAAFGVWAVLVGRVNIALSVVAAMTFGIVVDDTVHFLSKYIRARRENGLTPDDAVRYAFSNVGRAIIATTVILAAGFGILSFSAFDLNAGMGRLTAVTIVIAMVADFFFLPPLLLHMEARHRRTETETITISGDTDELPAIAG